MTSLLAIFIAALCLKLLFLFAYHSTDFEVHRNWIAITCSLPISQWYNEQTSEWTLDYPPFFAWFEWLLSCGASLFDPGICVVSKYPYVSTLAVLYQRLSVILSECVLLAAIIKLIRCLRQLHNKHIERVHRLLWFIVNFNYGLMIVDHIHFQYNGFLFGIYVFSIAFLIEGSYVTAAVFFTALLNFKHIFLYIAPVYFVYILVNYCLDSFEFVNFIKRLLKVSAVVIGVVLMAFGPFIYTNQLFKIKERLFPFDRGLCHAYWAPNFWAFYNFLDKVLIYLNNHLLHRWPVQSSSKVASMTGGLVGQVEHVILPAIKPLHATILSSAFMLPNLCQYARRSLKTKNKTKNLQEAFLTSLVIASWSCYMFGWHVHEKAVLMILLPLNILTLITGKYRFFTFYVSTLGYYSLIPLIHTKAESPFVASFFVVHTCCHWLILFRLLPMQKELQNREHIETTTNLMAKLNNYIEYLASIHLWGLVLLFLFTRIIIPLTSIGQRYPFTPLLMTSVYVAVGLICAFAYFIWISEACTKDSIHQHHDVDECRHHLDKHKANDIPAQSKKLEVDKPIYSSQTVASDARHKMDECKSDVGGASNKSIKRRKKLKNKS